MQLVEVLDLYDTEVDEVVDTTQTEVDVELMVDEIEQLALEIPHQQIVDDEVVELVM